MVFVLCSCILEGGYCVQSRVSGRYQRFIAFVYSLLLCAIGFHALGMSIEYSESVSSVELSESSVDCGMSSLSVRSRQRRAPSERRKRRRVVVPRESPRCWFCEFHTHPFVSQLGTAVVDNLRDTTAESVAVMVHGLITERIGASELDIDSSCYTVDETSVLRHITEHVVDTRVQFPHMIRSLQEVYSDVRRSLYVVSSDDEACVGAEVSERSGRTPNKSNVDTMVRISSQLALLYKMEGTLSLRGTGV